MLEALFPNGVSHYLLGGVLIALSVIVVYIPTAYITGASSTLPAFFSFFVKCVPKSFRRQRIMHFFGVVIGAFLFMMLFSQPFVTGVPMWRLIVGGFFIGLGSTLARGCTSGHGVCGLASMAKSSIVYVTIFMTVAICTALLISGVMS